MKRWRVDDNREIAFAEPNGDWVSWEDMLKEVRKFIDDLGGIGDHVSDADIENYFGRQE